MKNTKNLKHSARREARLDPFLGSAGNTSEYYVLSPEHTDPARIRREREKARKLQKSQWWLTRVNRGICHYCKRKFPPGELTMDHVVPLARGGASTPGNVAPACRGCNQEKKLRTPAEELLRD